MIGEPKIEVTCDGEDCRESSFIEPEYKYEYYDCDDEAIE